MNILHISSSEPLCVFVCDELIPLKMRIINAAKPIHGRSGCRWSPLYLLLSVIWIKNLKLYFSESPAEKVGLKHGYSPVDESEVFTTHLLLLVL